MGTVRAMDEYCNVCGDEDETQLIAQLRDGRSVCKKCAVHEHVCEICGSTRDCYTRPEDQIHYEEECFK